MSKVPKVERCILHIGTEKTGTSSIQHFLSMNRLALMAEGVVYPRFTGMDGGSQWGFVAAVLRRPWRSNLGARLNIHNDADASRYRSALISAIEEEIMACKEAKALLISCEHFHSRLVNPKLICSLKDLLGRWTDSFRVIVYFRRQDRLAVSYYSTKLKSGVIDPLVFPPEKRLNLHYYYDYAQIFENWAHVFGGEAMAPGLFEQKDLLAGDLLSDFCAKAGLSMAGKKRPGRVNTSLNERGVDLLHRLNRRWPKTRANSRNLVRRSLVYLIKKKYCGKHYPVSREQALRFFERFRDSNERLAAQAFPNHQSPLFSDNFADYPTQVASLDKATGWLARSIEKFKSLKL